MMRLLTVFLFALTTAAFAGQAPDRSKAPCQGPAGACCRQKYALERLPVWVVESHEVPVVNITLIVAWGRRRPGRPLARELHPAMLDEGAGNRVR
jgi:hypothetical protein